MSAEQLIAGLLRVASEDLDAARLLADKGNRNAIYLCSQAAEKVLRAVLTAEGKHAGIKHLLDEMVDMVPDENPLKTRLRAIDYLAAFATSYRYPSPTGRIKPPPGKEDVAEAINRTAIVLAEALSSFEVALDLPGTPARKASPPRRAWPATDPIEQGKPPEGEPPG
jgi:HEPN domain-containing protein